MVLWIDENDKDLTVSEQIASLQERLSQLGRLKRFLERLNLAFWLPEFCY